VQNPSFNQFFQYWEITQVPTPTAGDADLLINDNATLVWTGDGLFGVQSYEEYQNPSTTNFGKQWQSVAWSPTHENDSSGASVELEQWVDVCPGSQYTFTVEFQYAASGAKPAAGDCSLTLLLGENENDAVVVDWASLTSLLWAKQTSNTYTTWNDESSIPLSITLSCAHSVGITSTPTISGYIDDVRLVPVPDGH
jgi:hypothetical protein